MFEANQKPPYYVLGSRVQPQSDVLIVGDCSASYDVLNRQYVRAAQSRLKVGQVTQGTADDCQPNHVFMRGCADRSEQ